MEAEDASGIAMGLIGAIKVAPVKSAGAGTGVSGVVVAAKVGSGKDFGRRFLLFFCSAGICFFVRFAVTFGAFADIG